MSNRSFTLIELLVVIAIIGLITSVSLVAIDLPGQRQKARIAKTLEFSSSIQNALGSEARGIWDFDENGGTVATDRSGYGNNGTLNNFISPNGYVNDTPQAIVSASQGQGKYSLSFDGGGDYVDLGTGASLNFADSVPWSFEMWAKLAVSNGVFVRSTSDSNPALKLSATAFTFYRPNPYQLDSVTIDNLANVWSHIVLSTDSSRNMKVYQNGVYKGVIALTSSQMVFRYLGYTDAYHSWWFGGLIDDVRIYAQALTIGQIQQHYAEELEGHQNLAINK